MTASTCFATSTATFCCASTVEPAMWGVRIVRGAVRIRASAGIGSAGGERRGPPPPGEPQLALLGGNLATSTVQWSGDSSTVYYLNSSGALVAVPAKGGDVSSVAPDGVSSLAVAPAGDRLAYVRGGKIEVLTFAAGTTAELVVTPAPTLVGWAKDKVVWAAANGVYTQGADGPVQLAALPTTGAVSVLSIAPDATHAAYRQDQNLLLLDLATGKSLQLGQANAVFDGWSPDGSQLMYSGTGGNLELSDTKGNNVGAVPGAEASWSSQDAILLGSETDLYEARPDGSALTKLANGTYRQPVWAPNGTAFVFFRGGVLWTASAPALPPVPSVLDQATAVVKSFMDARQGNRPDQAAGYLDSSGKQAYTSGGLNLVINGDPSFSRYYVLTAAVTGTQPDAATFVVRIVLTHGKLDVADFEETLTVIRDATTHQFVIDQATVGEHRNLGKGAEVVGAGDVELFARRRESVIELHVADRGAGFPAGFLDRAFDRFSRADDARSEGGAGLGLSIVGLIAEGHGGAAHAANRADGGADVWLELPAKFLADS